MITLTRSTTAASSALPGTVTSGAATGSILSTDGDILFEVVIGAGRLGAADQLSHFVPTSIGWNGAGSGGEDVRQSPSGGETDRCARSIGGDQY